VARIAEIGTALAVTSNRRKLSSSETSVLKRATRRNITEDTILQTCRKLEKVGRKPLYTAVEGKPGEKRSLGTNLRNCENDVNMAPKVTASEMQSSGSVTSQWRALVSRMLKLRDAA
jgi:hypothetical protein